ncbi:MAG: hypothetical protein ACYCXW_02345 [Solirubrobacteraceae bacterium]
MASANIADGAVTNAKLDLTALDARYSVPGGALALGTYYLDDFTGTDDQKMTAALTALFAAGGGTIVLSARAHSFANQWATSYSAAVVTAVRIAGAGVAFNGAYRAASGATTTTFTYAGAGAAMCDFQHIGTIEITGIQFKQANTGKPFVLVTNAVPNIHDCVFSGGATGTSCATDAIYLGGTSTVIGSGDGAPYQGYQGDVRRNFFDGIRACVKVRTFANAVRIQGNTVPITCGTGNVFSVTDAAMTAGSGVLTSASTPFTAAMIGQPVFVAGAGPSAQGGLLAATISAFMSSGQVTLSAAATSTVFGATAAAPVTGAFELNQTSGAAQLSGILLEGNLIESSHYPVSIILRGATSNMLLGNSFWDATPATLGAVYCDAQSQGNMIIGVTELGGAPGLLEDYPGFNLIIDPAVGHARCQLAGNQVLTWLVADSRGGIALGPQSGPADITLQRAQAVALLTFLNNNGYLRVVANANGSGMFGGRVNGAAYDAVQFSTNGSGQGQILLGTGAASPSTVLQYLGAGLFGPGGTVAWMAYGGERWRAATAVANNTALAASRVISCDATAGNITQTLTHGNDGEVHTVIKTDASANTITVVSTGSKTINGAASYVLSAQWQKATFMYSAAAGQWLVVA